MNPQNVLTILGGAVGILTFLGVVVVYLRGSADKGTIGSLKSSVEAMEIAEKIKDEKIADLEKRDREKDARIAQLTAEVKTLRNVITNADEVKAISVLLADHHRDSMNKLDEIEGVIVRAK